MFSYNCTLVKKLHVNRTGMKKFMVDATHCSPYVLLDHSGEIMISGRSMMDDPESFFKPLCQWIKFCAMDHARVSIRLEYANSESYRQIFHFLTLLTANQSIRKLEVIWFYDKGDEETLEMGRDFENLLKCPFEYLIDADSLV